MAELKIFNNPQHVAEEFADFFYKEVQECLMKKASMHVALSGGSTPKLWFKILKEKYSSKMPWHIIHFYWGDERMVSALDSESNYGEALRILFDHISIPEENIHPVIGENSIDSEITRYKELIYNNLEKSENIPVFDLIVLGMGDDGHTASIFPNQLKILESEHVCAKAEHPDTGQIRLTLTGKVINRARNIVFLITGENKAKKLGTIFLKKSGYEKFPASYIEPYFGKLFFFIDKAAATEINR
jgi:6-phosphogluconolactonase